MVRTWSDNVKDALNKEFPPVQARQLAERYALSFHGGYKEVIARVAGADVYSRLKFESGAHRVQRVPETESQGRIHTSACTVAVMAEVEQIDEVEINKADLRIDTFRASGAGGPAPSARLRRSVLEQRSVPDPL